MARRRDARNRTSSCNGCRLRGNSYAARTRFSPQRDAALAPRLATALAARRSTGGSHHDGRKHRLRLTFAGASPSPSRCGRRTSGIHVDIAPPVVRLRSAAALWSSCPGVPHVRLRAGRLGSTSSRTAAATTRTTTATGSWRADYGGPWTYVEHHARPALRARRADSLLPRAAAPRRRRPWHGHGDHGHHGYGSTERHARQAAPLGDGTPAID